MARRSRRAARCDAIQRRRERAIYPSVRARSGTRFVFTDSAKRIAVVAVRFDRRSFGDPDRHAESRIDHRRAPVCALRCIA
jgi:hypothetical protein